MRTPVESVDEKGLHVHVPTGKTITRSNLGFHLPFLLEIFIDKQYKAVGQGAEIKATHAS